MRVARKDLMAAIKAVAPVTEKHNTIPILGTMLLRATGSRLWLTTTDLDLTATTSVAYIDNGFDTALGNVMGLYGLLKASADGDVVRLVQELSEDKKFRGKIGIGCGDMSASLTALPVDDFPEIPRQRRDWTATAGTDFMRALARVSIAVSTEETRYYLNGIYFHHVKDWTYRLVATDGHRLVYANVELPDAAALDDSPFDPGSTKAGVIIPRKMLQHMLRVHNADRTAPVVLALGPCCLNDKGKPLEGGGGVARFGVEVGDVQLVTKLIDGTFPDYTRVIPPANAEAHTAKVKTADVRRVLGGLMGMASERTKAIKLTIGHQNVNFSVTSPENGNAGINVEAETGGNPYEIGFNGRYLLAMATATGGEHMLLQAADAASPCRITDPDATDVVTVCMPMRVH